MITTDNTNDIEAISVQELSRLRQENADFILLDVREPSEYEICNLQGLLIPLAELPHRLAELDKDKRIIVHCRTSPRSQHAVKLLKAAGFKTTCYLKGGILAWANEIEPSMPVY